MAERRDPWVLLLLLLRALGARLKRWGEALLAAAGVGSGEPPPGQERNAPPPDWLARSMRGPPHDWAERVHGGRPAQPRRLAESAHAGVPVPSTVPDGWMKRARNGHAGRPVASAAPAQPPVHRAVPALHGSQAHAAMPGGDAAPLPARAPMQGGPGGFAEQRRRPTGPVPGTGFPPAGAPGTGERQRGQPTRAASSAAGAGSYAAADADGCTAADAGGCTAAEQAAPPTPLSPAPGGPALRPAHARFAAAHAAISHREMGAAGGLPLPPLPVRHAGQDAHVGPRRGDGQEAPPWPPLPAQPDEIDPLPGWHALREQQHLDRLDSEQRGHGWNGSPF